MRGVEAKYVSSVVIDREGLGLSRAMYVDFSCVGCCGCGRCFWLNVLYAACRCGLSEVAKCWKLEVKVVLFCDTLLSTLLYCTVLYHPRPLLYIAPVFAGRQAYQKQAQAHV